MEKTKEPNKRQLYHLEEIQELDVKGLDDLKENVNKTTLSDLKKLEKDLIKQNLAPSFPAWLLFEYEFVRKNPNELAIAMKDISGINFSNKTVTKLIEQIGIPYRRSARRPKEPMSGILRNIAEAAIRKNLPINSHTVRKHSSDSFYSGYGFGKENMNKLVEKIKKLDTKRYSHFEYVPQEKSKIGHKELTDPEKAILRELLLQEEVVAGSKTPWPNGARANIVKKFKKINPERRSPSSIAYQIRTLENGGYTNYNLKEAKNPLRNGKRKHLEDHIKEIVIELENQHEEHSELESNLGIDNKDERQKRRHQLLQYLPDGHQKIIAYLLEKEHYQALFGNDVVLKAVDFNIENTRPWLYNPFSSEAENLEGMLEGEASLVDKSIRCDMILRKKNGIFIVNEVKQNAIDMNFTKGVPTSKKKVIANENGEIKVVNIKKEDRDRTENTAQRAVRQIGKYVGSMQFYTELKDFENMDNPDYIAIKDPVRGYLTAYTIQKNVYDFLNSRKPVTRAHVLSKDLVNDYIAEVIAERQNKEKSNSKSRKKTNLISETSTRPGIGVFDPIQGLVEIDQVSAILPMPLGLYYVNGDLNGIENLVSRGMLVTGEINAEKYKKEHILPIKGYFQPIILK